MVIPDFVGEKLEIALDIIKKQYPALKYEIIYNHAPSPKNRDESNKSSATERIVRQKLIDNEKLEFTISLFKEEPDSFEGKQY